MNFKEQHKIASFLCFISTALMVISSNDKIFHFLKDTAIELILTTEFISNNNTIFTLCAGYITGYILYFLTSYAPENRRRVLERAALAVSISESIRNLNLLVEILNAENQTKCIDVKYFTAYETKSETENLNTNKGKIEKNILDSTKEILENAKDSANFFHPDYKRRINGIISSLSSLPEGIFQAIGELKRSTNSDFKYHFKVEGLSQKVEEELAKAPNYTHINFLTEVNSRLK